MTSTSVPDQQPDALPATPRSSTSGCWAPAAGWAPRWCKAVNAADDLELVAMVDEGDWLFDVANAGAQVVVDFTRPDVVMDNIRFCIDQNIHCVVGTTGFDEAKLATIAEWLEPKPDVGVVIAPNFGIGAVLLMKFAAGGGPLLPLGRDRRAAPPEQGRRPVGHGRAHRPAGRRRPPGRRPGRRRRTRPPTTLPGARGADVDGRAGARRAAAPGWSPTRRCSWAPRGRR